MSIDWSFIVKRFEEYDKKFYSILAELREHRKILEEHRKILEEHGRTLGEHGRILERMLHRLDRIELTLGALSESTYCRFALEDLKEEIKGKGESIIRVKRRAVIEGAEVDLLVETDKRVYVIEVKSRPTIGDVGALMAKSEVISKKAKKEVVPILVGTMIGKEVMAYASGKGIVIKIY